VTTAENKSYVCQFCKHDLSHAQILLGKHHSAMKFHHAIHARDDLTALLEEKRLIPEVRKIYSKYNI